MGDDVHAINITKELNRLHQDQAEKKEMRASLFTLIIYVHEEQRSHYLQDIVQNVIEKYPCRIIFIHADRDPSSTHLRVRVSSAQNNKGGVLILCDQISIEVGSQNVHRVPFLVLPHLLTDLPVYLLWGQDPTVDNEILPTLEKLATRLIFDAECAKSLKQFSQVILQKKKTLPIELLDLNWALGSGWRDVLFQSFYQPEHLQQLIKSSQISILYNNRQSDWIHQPEMQAIYLQAWIASRLGWQFKSMYGSETERLFTYLTSNGAVHLKLQPCEIPSLPAGEIIRFEQISTEGFILALERDLQQSKISVHFSSPRICELPFTLPLVDFKRGFTFMNEIFYSIPSPHYVKVLELLNEIDWQ